MARWAVVLAGGSGSRFWPLSTPENPKQFLCLTGDTTLLRQTVDRLQGVVPPNRTIIVTGTRYVDRTRVTVPEIPAENVLGEPKAASTGPALTWACHVIRQQDPEATVLSVHADWYVDDVNAFRQDAQTALSEAETHDVLITIGVVPTRPDVGYGYIVPGSSLSQHASHVDRFVEKPSQSSASSLIEAGALWNCGLFAWPVTRFFIELEQHAPELSPHVSRLTSGDVVGFFESVTPIAIDKSHFERSDRVAVLSASFAWDDIGTWSALARTYSTDNEGNVLVGDVQAEKSRHCIVWMPDERVALLGVEGLVIARHNGVTLVSTKQHVSKLREFVENLPEDWRDP